MAKPTQQSDPKSTGTHLCEGAGALADQGRSLFQWGLPAVLGWLIPGAGHMLLYLTMAWIGFWGGHALGVRWELEFFSMGPLHLGTALLGCFIGLGFGYWLGLVEISDIE